MTVGELALEAQSLFYLRELVWLEGGMYRDQAIYPSNFLQNQNYGFVRSGKGR